MSFCDILNAKASDVGLLQARASALQGNIQAAQETVNRAVDLKFSAIDAQLNTYEAQLNALQPTLNKEEKARAQAQQMLLEERRQALEDKKQEEKNIQNLMLEAVEAGIVDSDTLNKMSSAKSYAEALQFVNSKFKQVSEDKNNQIFETTDARGNVTYVTVSKTTGKIIGQVSAGQVGKGFKGSSGGDGGGGGGGSGNGGEMVDGSGGSFLSFDEWLQQKQDKDQMTYNITNSKVKDMLEKQYEEEVGTSSYVSSGVNLTPTDKKKLEAAGLIRASREEQIQFLYGKNKTSDSGSSISFEDF